MQINSAPFHMAQAVLMGVVAAMSVAILGTAAHTLDVFNKQQPINPWWLQFWPQHFDVNGTKGLVGSAVTTLVLSLAFLVVALVPFFNLTEKYTLRALVALGTTLPSILVTLVTVIYAHILNGDAPQLDTIQTWTCKYKNSQPLPQGIEMTDNMGNGNFGSLCRESKFALYGTLVVCLMLSANMGLAIVTWLADKWASRKSRKQMEAEANGSLES